jgi:hypothetical protein
MVRSSEFVCRDVTNLESKEVPMVFFPRTLAASKGGLSVAFPDVCKVPAPPAPFVPIPYPNSQLEENLKTANKVDAKAESGDKTAKKQQAEAINNLKMVTGQQASSATQAVLIGKTVHAKFLGKAARVKRPVNLRMRGR